MMLALFNFHVLPFSNSNEKLIMVAFMIFIDVLYDQQTMGICLIFVNAIECSLNGHISSMLPLKSRTIEEYSLLAESRTKFI